MQVKFEIGWSGEELPGQRLEDAEGVVFVDVAIQGKTMPDSKTEKTKDTVGVILVVFGETRGRQR